MKHYYDDHPFTSAQAEYAQQVVIDLISKRRFFLHHEHPNSHYKNDHSLHPEVFAKAIALNSSLTNVYKEMQAESTKRILEAETSLGIAHAKLPADTVMVECKKYSGGFEVCRVYPLSSFLVFAPTLKQLLSEMYERELHGKLEDDYSKNELAKKKETSNILAQKIFADIEKLRDSDPDNKKCLVLLNSLVHCGGNDNGDFAKNKLKDMQDTPHGVGYLFWKFSQRTRIVRHNFVAFSTSRASHVILHHWNGENEIPKIGFDRDAGYTCAVMAAIVM